MNLLTQNSKLKKTSKHFDKRVFNFGIPAYKTASGKTTCPFADKCVKFCYAKKGAYIWSNVKPAFEKRYALTKTDQFISAMTEEIKKKKAPGGGGRSRATPRGRDSTGRCNCCIDS